VFDREMRKSPFDKRAANIALLGSTGFKFPDK